MRLSSKKATATTRACIMYVYLHTCESNVLYHFNAHFVLTRSFFFFFLPPPFFWNASLARVVHEIVRYITMGFYVDLDEYYNALHYRNTSIYSIEEWFRLICICVCVTVYMRVRIYIRTWECECVFVCTYVSINSTRFVFWIRRWGLRST